VGTVFVGGNLALDFVGTLNERHSNRVENLLDPADVGRWFVEAGVLDAAPDADDDDLAVAIALREAMFGVVESLVDGKPLRRADLDRINRAADVEPPSVRVTYGGRRRRTGGVANALSAVARDALDLFAPADGAVLKWCADSSCTHPFLDRSRGHRRRWCDMAGCGDRAKAAAYRTRQRTGQRGMSQPTGPISSSREDDEDDAGE
jgi:predicted RNA-binding Zn ribbon-like protein